MRNLEDLFDRYSDQPDMREAARWWRRAATRSIFRGRPLTGTYYWAPVPGRFGVVEWELQEFYDCWLPSADFEYTAKHIQDSLAIRWGREISMQGVRQLPWGVVSEIARPPTDDPPSTRWCIRWKCGLLPSAARQKLICERFNSPERMAVLTSNKMPKSDVRAEQVAVAIGLE